MKKYLLTVFVVFTILISTCMSYAASNDITAISVSIVNHDPDPAIAGDVVEVRFGIENTGGEPAADLVVELAPEYPFELVPGENAIQEIGTIKGHQDEEDLKIIKYMLKVNRDATAGSYELKVKYYEAGSTSRTQKSLSIEVRNKESAEVIYIDKTTLIPGKETSLKFTINNVGNAPLRDLSFHWINEDKIILPVGSDNTKYIKYVDIGDSIELEYNVIADTNAEPGLYEMDLYLTYDDPLTGYEKNITTLAGLYVGGGTDFDVAFSESSNGAASFSVANIGSNPAYSVSVIIPQQKDWRVSGSNSVIIGNLNKGDYTVASFKLQSGSAHDSEGDTNSGDGPSREDLLKLRESMQSSEKLLVEIAYTDTMGKRDVIEKEVQLSLQSITSTGTDQVPKSAGMGFQDQSFFSKYRWQIIGIAAILVVLIIHRKHSKRKLVNPDYKMKHIFKKEK